MADCSKAFHEFDRLTHISQTLLYLLQLESLKNQYEEQIAQLKGELEDTTRRTPDDPGGTTGPSAEEQGGAEGQTAPSPGPVALGQVCNFHSISHF